jgi:hypothetical protein
MPAKDYIIAVTPLTNTVWICKPSKRDQKCMTYDRVAVDPSKFIGVVLEWAHNQIKENSDTMQISSDGQVVAEIKINRKLLGLK